MLIHVLWRLQNSRNLSIYSDQSISVITQRPPKIQRIVVLAIHLTRRREK